MGHLVLSSHLTQRKSKIYALKKNSNSYSGTYLGLLIEEQYFLGICTRTQVFQGSKRALSTKIKDCSLYNVCKSFQNDLVTQIMIL